jgi:hypothetical protein
MRVELRFLWSRKGLAEGCAKRPQNQGQRVRVGSYGTR